MVYSASKVFEKLSMTVIQCHADIWKADRLQTRWKKVGNRKNVCDLVSIPVVPISHQRCIKWFVVKDMTTIHSTCTSLSNWNIMFPWCWEGDSTFRMLKERSRWKMNLEFLQTTSPKSVWTWNNEIWCDWRRFLSISNMKSDFGLQT